MVITFMTHLRNYRLLQGHEKKFFLPFTFRSTIYLELICFYMV